MSLKVERCADGVLVITLSHGPVNAVATPLRRALMNALMDAEQDDTVRAVVITGRGAIFSAGADLVEFSQGRAFDAPSFHASVLPFLHGMRKPVVAAINGRAIGGGLELALWCHARVAVADAPLGLPEVTLGLMPGAGGTQLLPRALGLERATALIVSGALAPACAFEGTPLIDAVAPAGHEVEAARAKALELVGKGQPLPHLARRAVAHAQPQGFLAFARAQARARRDFVPSMLAAIDGIALSLKLPALEGLAAEFELFRPLVGSPAARAVRHAFLAERAAFKVEDMAEGVEPLPVRRAAVVGAGYMGEGIAHCLAMAGLEVQVYDAQTGAATHCVQRLLGELRLAGRSLRVADRLDELAGADLVVEAVVEDLAIKQEVFRALDRVVSGGCILATNTSTLDVDAIAAVTSRPGQVLGMHFFGPAPVMKLLELVRGKDTAEVVLATALDLARRMCKVPVVSRVGPGFIANRIYSRFMAQALQLAGAGVRPARIDVALERFGWRMGPFRTMDLVGNDVLVKGRLLGARLSEGDHILDALVARGRLGQKCGAGWYDYAADSRVGRPSAALEALLPPPAEMAADAIVDRCMLAMINEAARVLACGVAQRASDIDVSFLLGYGFPRLKGGPLFHAEASGLAVVVQKLQALERETGDGEWAPSPLLLQGARGGALAR